ncbi:MAG TPA: S8 family serine peptidase [Burkholderiaceae bacterium]
MLRPAIGKVLLLCTALSLPALAAAPAATSARVIVKFKDDGVLMRESALAVRGADLPRVRHAARLSQRFGMALRDGNAVAPRTQVLHARGVSSADLVARLRIDPDVEYAEVDVRVKRSAAPNDPHYAGGQTAITPAVGQWYLRTTASGAVSSINAEQAWDLTPGSPAIVVAVLDTGVRGDHPDLVGKLLRGYDFVSEDSDGVFDSANDGDGRDADPSDPGDWVTQDEANGIFSGQGCDVGDSSWHGTQTSSLVAAATNDGVGMAGTGRNVRVLPVRVLGKCGGFTSDVIAAMYWAAGLAIPSSPSTLGTAPANTTPAKVLNLSLGSAQPCSALYQAAVTAVTAAGASVVVSAGNGEGTAVGQPANCAGAIGVGGLRHVGTKVGFSDVGTQVAISAPGGNCVNTFGDCLFPILTATNSGTTIPANHVYSDSVNFSVGTSFSAPMAAAVAALMLSRNPALTPAEVRSRMLAAARVFPTTGGSPGTPMCQPPSSTPQDECYCTTSTCGAGMLDAQAAVAAAGSPAQPRALIFTTPALVPSGTSITVDGSTSVGGAGVAIDAYEWTMVSSGGIANLQLPRDAATATVSTTGEGTFTIRLRVTDANSVQDTREFTVRVAAPSAPPPSNSDSGGGSMSWPWLLALLFAVALLRPRRAL